MPQRRGTIGTSRSAPITFTINGVSGAATNNFVGTNSGLLNGSLNVTNLGGRGSLQNSGTITDTVTLTGRGDQTYSGAGAIQGGPFAFTGNVGLNVASLVQTSSFDSVTQRSTISFAGGTASATINGTVGSGASSSFSIRSLVSDSSSSSSGSTVNTPTSSANTGTS